MQYVPRSLTVTQSEMQGKTTIEAAPESEQAGIYRKLANRIFEHNISKVPNPLEEHQLREWAARCSKDILRIESESVSMAGAGV
jgi:nitrogenase iron protein NifH